MGCVVTACIGKMKPLRKVVDKFLAKFLVEGMEISVNDSDVSVTIST